MAKQAKQQGADAVAVARGVLEDVEAEAAKEGKRLAKALEAADAYAAEAAGIDPDADPGAFEDATARLGGLRARVEIVRTREAAAQAKVGAAREALAAAELAERRSALDRLAADLDAREARAHELARGVLAELGAELAEIGRVAAEHDALVRALGAAPTIKPRSARGAVPFTHNVLGAIDHVSRGGRF